MVVAFYFVLAIVFCKQNTAYEMRISDWSSDVCSSDLRLETRRAYRTKCAVVKGQLHGKPLFQSRRIRTCRSVAVFQTIGRSLHGREGDSTAARPIYPLCFRKSAFPPLSDRSEEHTSELQSLMRISYAVF